MPQKEQNIKNKVIEELLALVDSGYDGPFMGEAVESLFAAVRLYKEHLKLGRENPGYVAFFKAFKDK